MRRVTAIIFCFIQLFLWESFGVKAQTADLKAHQELKDSFIVSFNNDDFKGIYLMKADGIRQPATEDAFVNWLSSVKKETGSVTASSLIADLKDVKYFKLVGQKKSLKLELSAQSAGRYLDFDLSDFKELSGEAERAIRSDNLRKAPIDSAVHQALLSFMADSRSVGLSVGIYLDGKTHFYNYGEVEFGKGQISTNKTLYEIASITKTFTATLLARAVLDKKVSLDDDVRKYLEGSYPNLEFQGQSIKLLHLINFTSGLPQFFPDNPDIFKTEDPDSIPQKLIELNQGYTWADFIKDLHQVKLERAPGSGYKYSNAGVQLLGAVLERVYGIPYEVLVKREIADPLGMRDTEITLSASQTMRLAKGFNEKRNPMPRNLKQSQAAGGLHSTVFDMMKYVMFHLKEEKTAVGLSHRPTLGDPDVSAIGMAWRINKTRQGYRRLSATGGSFGFSSLCVIYPDLNFGLVLLSNEADINTQQRLSDAERDLVNRIQIDGLRPSRPAPAVQAGGRRRSETRR